MSLSSRIMLQNMAISHVKSCSVKNVFLEISQNSPEKICAGVSISIKLNGTGVFLWNLRNFLENLFLQKVPGGCFYEHLILTVYPDFVISRTSQIPWQKHTSEHLFYRTVPSGCFQMSVFFLKGKTKTIFNTSSDLNRLQIICIKIKILLILYSKKTTRIFLPIFSIKNTKNHFVCFLFLCWHFPLNFCRRHR